jgi:hypothetical protein
LLLAADSSPRPDVPKGSKEIADRLLAEVGLTEPDDEHCQRALAAYDAMVVELELIRDEAMGLH